MFAYFLPRHQHAAKDTALKQVREAAAKGSLSGQLFEFSSQDELAKFVAQATSLQIKSFVAVGSDRDFHSLINTPANVAEIAFGYIPLTPRSHLAAVLELSNLKNALAALRQRRLTTYPVMLLNQKRIVGDVEIEFAADNPPQLELDQSLTVSGPLQRLRLHNSSLEARVTKAIELEGFGHPTAKTTSAPARLELPASRQAQHRPPTRLMHVLADKLEISAQQPFQDSIVEQSSRQLKISIDMAGIHLITPKHSELLEV